MTLSIIMFSSVLRASASDLAPSDGRLIFPGGGTSADTRQPAATASVVPRGWVTPATSSAPLTAADKGSDQVGPPREAAPPNAASAYEGPPVVPWYSTGYNGSTWWVQGEYLLWWIKDSPVPLPLVTNGPVEWGHHDHDHDHERNQVLFGGGDVDFGSTSGGRLAIGAWLDNYHIFGAELRGFLLARQVVHGTFSSDEDGFPPLVIPFVNNQTGRPDFSDVAIPDQTIGLVNVALSSEFWGAEANLIFNLYRGEDFTLDIIGGYRYLGLEESLQLSTATSPLPHFFVAFGGCDFPAPALTTTFDRIAAQTNFHGGQLGARMQWHLGGFSVDLTGKVALGDSATSVSESGFSSLHAGPSTSQVTLPGGLLVQQSNAGHQDDNDFAVVPEIELKLGYQIGSHLTLFASYDFLYWSRVVRPGQQINPLLTPGQVPTFNEFGQGGVQPFQPQPTHMTTDFWSHGVGFGLEIRF
jgi:hypothetical protein